MQTAGLQNKTAMCIVNSHLILSATLQMYVLADNQRVQQNIFTCTTHNIKKYAMLWTKATQAQASYLAQEDNWA